MIHPGCTIVQLSIDTTIYDAGACHLTRASWRRASTFAFGSANRRSLGGGVSPATGAALKGCATWLKRSTALLKRSTRTTDV